MIRECGAPESSLEVSGGAQGSGSTWADGVARGEASARFWSVISFGVQSTVGLACLGWVCSLAAGVALALAGRCIQSAG